MEQLPKIVQQGLRRTAEPAVHPDPDLMTAFAEKSLTERERMDVLQHLAVCADCRDILALAMPETATEPLPSFKGSSWLTWPMLRWGALAACVVVVGAAVTLHYNERQAERSVAEKVSTAPSAGAVESNTPKQSTAQIAPGSYPGSIMLGRDSAGAAGNLARQNEKKSLNDGMASARAKISPHSPDRSASYPAAPAPMLAGNPEPEQAAKARTDTLDYASRTNNQTVSVDSAAAAPMEQKTTISELKAKDEAGKNELHKESQTAGAIAGAALQDRKANTLSAMAETVEVTSGAVAKRSRVKGNSPHWTISPDGSVQRSYDSGKSWQKIPIASGVVFHALTANDSDIWVGGAAGALYHSADNGEHWSKVIPTAGDQALTSGIVTLEFSDPRHGRLTTSTRETWITNDAGETWQRR